MWLLRWEECRTRNDEIDHSGMTYTAAGVGTGVAGVGVAVAAAVKGSALLGLAAVPLLVGAYCLFGKGNERTLSNLEKATEAYSRRPDDQR